MNGGGGEDRLSSLPDSLLCQILLKLSTKHSIRTSVLSRGWANLWRYVPRLDLCHHHHQDYKAFVRFGDRFLGFNGDSRLQRFKIKIHFGLGEVDREYHNGSDVARWINDVVGRKLEHLKVQTLRRHTRPIPPTVYTCESLVSLRLRNVILPSPEFVTLPSVKAIYLDKVWFADGWDFETLLSGCPVLERLTLRRNSYDKVKVLRVCSNSLLSFTHFGNRCFDKEDLVVAIDAPRLYYLKLHDHETSSFIIHNLGSLVEVDISIAFNLKDRKRFNPNDLPKVNMIRNFLVGISTVKDMVICPYTLKVIYNYLRHQQPLPLFSNLSFMRVTNIRWWYRWMPTTNYEWQMLPVFLERCPSLRDLDLESTRYLEKGGFSSLSERRCFLSSLEYVEITGYGRAVDMKVVSYFLENSTMLKELALRLNGKEDESVILREILTIPRLSTSCQVVVLSSS